MKQKKSKNEPHVRQGYILILTMMILAAMITVITHMFVRSTTYAPFMNTMINRQRAKQLAFGGIQVAIAQLARPDEQKQDENEQGAVMKNGEKQNGEKQNGEKSGGAEAQKKGAVQKKLTPDEQAKQFLTRFLPILNKWQEFTLQEKVDGIDGALKICFVSEEGKININEIYDFEAKKFEGEENEDGGWKKILETVFKNVQQQMGGADLLTAFEKFLQERKHRILDVTELLAIKEFAIFKRNQFFEPTTQTIKRGDSSGKSHKRPLYLTDIFTVQSHSGDLQPWLLSDSLMQLLEIPERNLGSQEGKELSPDVLKKFKRRSSWKRDWDEQLKPIYSKELHSLPKGIELVFDNIFEPEVFSVLVHGTVGNVTQRLMVIVERTKPIQNENDNGAYDVKIKKLYWL